MQYSPDLERAIFKVAIDHNINERVRRMKFHPKWSIVISSFLNLPIFVLFISPFFPVPILYLLFGEECQ
jgi:hypothetical protein